MSLGDTHESMKSLEDCTRILECHICFFKPSKINMMEILR